MKSSNLLPQAIITTALLSAGPCAMAFVSPSSSASSVVTMRRTMCTTSSPRHHPRPSPSLPPLHATLAAEELSTMTKEEKLNALGLESEDKLALGIDAEEVLELIGTRDDLITKFKEDIPNLSQSEVETEVDKLLLDGEMLDVWIKYSERKREDPNWSPEYAEEDTSPLNQVLSFVSEYGIYFILAFVFKDVISSYLPKNDAAGDADVLVSSALDGIHHFTTFV